VAQRLTIHKSDVFSKHCLWVMFVAMHFPTFNHNAPCLGFYWYRLICSLISPIKESIDVLVPKNIISNNSSGGGEFSIRPSLKIVLLVLQLN